MNEQTIFHMDSCRVSAERLEACLTVNRDAAIFEEHFPDFPIVPGACIVGFVVDCVALMNASHPQDLVLSRVAFHEPVVPGLELSLVIDSKTDAHHQHSYGFRIHQEAINHCRGLITLQGARA